MKTVYYIEKRLGDVRGANGDDVPEGCFIRESVTYDNHVFTAHMSVFDRYKAEKYGFTVESSSIFDDGVCARVLTVARIGRENTAEAIRVARGFFDKERAELLNRAYLSKGGHIE